MSETTNIMSNSKAIISTVASIAASAMLIRSITNELIPDDVTNFFYSQINNLRRRFFSSELTIVIEELHGMTRNQVYDAAEAYLGKKATISTAQRVQARKSEDDKKLLFVVDKDEEICDVFEGIEVKWRLCCINVETSNNRGYNDTNSSFRSESRSYELTFHKKHKEVMFNSYLPYLLERSKVIKEENLALKLHTVKHGYWNDDVVNFGHPMMFETLAIDAALKKEVMEDLDKFVKGKEFYKKTGKAWKRGYLLYGPPGTGKSSLIASMANYLNYDVYDLDLTDIYSNLDLKTLVLAMSNRSILVIEDIDCTIKLKNREEEEEKESNGDNKVTLSGLLNAIDGLWSCCGEERVIVFTTNHKEKLDPTLLRPGRMDMHIHLSYCTFSAFQQLAFNYLGISQHELFQEIEGLLGQVQVTPAEIAGELTKNIDSIDPLQDLVEFINKKIMTPVLCESKTENRLQEPQRGCYHGFHGRRRGRGRSRGRGIRRR